MSVLSMVVAKRLCNCCFLAGRDVKVLVWIENVSSAWACKGESMSECWSVSSCKCLAVRISVSELE